jgi:hypothetical protein
MLKFTVVQNILDIQMKYKILGFCRLGFNRRKFVRTNTLGILTEYQLSARAEIFKFAVLQ